ncbi:SPOR domain-containing protein [Pseudomonadota bacterium]
MRNDFDTDFEILDRSENNRNLQKIIIKLSAVVVVLLFVIFLITKLFGGNNKNGDVPLIETENQLIKEEHNIEDEIVIENLDVEVYDNITRGSITDYNNLNVIDNQKFIDRKIQEEKREIKKGKMAENQKNKANAILVKEEQYAELKKGLNNNDLVNNIKEGKDIKPSIKIQLSASSSKDNAEQYWKQLLSKYSDLFESKYHFIDVIDLGDKGKFYRLQVGYFSSNSNAKEFCENYTTKAKKNKTDCIIIQSK